MKREQSVVYRRKGWASLTVILLGLIGIVAMKSAAASQPPGETATRLLLPMVIRPNQIRAEPVGEGFIQVTAIESAGDERLFIVQRQGVIKVMEPTGETAVFLDLSDRVNSSHTERGLLDIAFHPDFATSGYFFVHYTTALGENASVVSRFQAKVGGTSADPASELQLLRITDNQPAHNGGELLYHPLDGGLYLGMGDDWHASLAQDAASVKGKLLRLDVSGEPTAELQPILDAQARVAVEVVAMGLRNPWRFDVDPANGRIFIADVGNSAWEEINLLPPEMTGINFGWPCREGTAVFKDTDECADPGPLVDPVHTVGHGGDFCAIIGGKVQAGGYLYGDFCAQELFWLFPTQSGWSSTSFGPLIIPDLLTTFGQDSQGRFYAGTLGNHSPIYRLTLP